MPNLRLTDREAGDITAYLMSLKNSEFEQLPVPAPDAAALDEVTLELLRTSLPDQMAQERLGGMSEQEKLIFSGESLIRRYGCFGCHDISGFEKSQKIGVDLSELGLQDGVPARFWLYRHRTHPTRMARAETASASQVR